MSGQPPRLLRPEDLQSVTDLGLIARKIVEGSIIGLHRSPAHGFSVEFAEYREYAPGDDLRYFDWKALGRSDRTYIKKFHTETNTRCHLLLDVSASMGYGEPSKFHYARCLLAAIAYVAIRQQDAVGLFALENGIRSQIPSGYGTPQLRHICSYLEGLEPGGATHMADRLHDLAQTLSARGIVILVSDLYDDDDAVFEAVRHFRFRGHEVVVFHLLDNTELNFDFDGLRDFVDLETGSRVEVHGPSFRDEYLRELHSWTDACSRAMSACQAAYVQVDTREPFATALAAFLHQRRTVGGRQ